MFAVMLGKEHIDWFYLANFRNLNNRTKHIWTRALGGCPAGPLSMKNVKSVLNLWQISNSLSNTGKDTST